MSVRSCRVEGVGGNREVPPVSVVGARADATMEEEGGTRA
jgi:hypothetical protein